MKFRTVFTHDSPRSARRLAVTVASFVLALLVAQATRQVFSADKAATWDGTTNNWSSSHWSFYPPPGPIINPFPNNGNEGLTYDATINGGTVTLDQDITIQDFTLYGGSIDSASSYTLTIKELFTWRGTHPSLGNSGMLGTGQTIIAPGGTLLLTNNPNGGFRQLQRTLVNNGAATWSRDADNFNEMQWINGTITNNGSFTTSSAGLIDNYGAGGTNVFNNVGTFTKQGTGTTQFRTDSGSGVAFNNSGTVDVQAGVLSLQSGGTHSGDFTGLAGAILHLGGGHSFAVGADVTGGLTVVFASGTTTDNGQINTAGTVEVTGGTTTLNGSVTASALNITGGMAVLNGPIAAPGGTLYAGSLSSSANWNISNTLTWRGTHPSLGNSGMLGTGQTIIAPGGTLLLTNNPNGGFRQLQRTLVNNGAATWSRDADNFNEMQWINGTITNNGSFTTSSAGLIDNYGAGGTNVFNNVGTFTKQGTGTTQFRNNGAALAFNNTGTVNVQAGTLSLESGGSGSGQFIVNPGATLRFVGGGFNYTGGFTLSNGTLQLTTYTLQNGAVRGTGTIAATSFTNASEISPGIAGGAEVGAITVNGTYVQTTVGSLTVDIEGTMAGQFDTVTINGTAQLGGTLEIDASNLTTASPGTLFPIVTASSITGKFDLVESTGNSDVYFLATKIAATAYAQSMDRGDMNGDTTIDNQDFELFAFGLMNRSTSKYFAKCDCDILPQQGGDFSGNGRLDFDDIAGFQSQMSGRGLSSDGLMAAIDRYLSPVPEPSSAVLVIFGGSIAIVMYGKRVRRDRITVATPVSGSAIKS